MEENSIRRGGEAHSEHGAEGKAFGTQGGKEACFPEASVHLHISDYEVQRWSKTGLGNNQKITQALLLQQKHRLTANYRFQELCGESGPVFYILLSGESSGNRTRGK